MSPAATMSAAYRAAEIETISQKELIVRLYQGAERFLEAGRQAMELRHYESALTHCRRGKDIFIELLSTLNFEQGGEVAQQLKQLYAFLIFQISEGSLRKRPEQIAALMPIIVTLREAWQLVPDEHADLSSVRATHDGHTFNFTS